MAAALRWTSAQQDSAKPGPEAFRYQYTQVDPAAVESGPATPSGRLAVIQRESGLTLPVAGIGTPTLWFAGVSSSAATLDFTGFMASQRPLLAGTLDWVWAYLGMFHAYAGDRQFVGVLVVARYADDLGMDAPLLVGGEALWTRQADADSRWGWGLSLTSALGDPLPVPLLAYSRWSASWTADMELPLQGRVRYWPAERIGLGADWKISGGAYTITAANAPMDEARFTDGVLTGVVAFGARHGPQVELSWGQTLFERYWAVKGGRRLVTFYFHPAATTSAALAFRF